MTTLKLSLNGTLLTKKEKTMHYVEETIEHKISGLEITSLFVIFEDTATFPVNYDLLFLKNGDVKVHKNLEEKIAKSKKLKIWVQNKREIEAEQVFYFLRKKPPSKQSFQSVQVDMAARYTFELLKNNGFYKDGEIEVSRSKLTLHMEKIK